MDDKQIDLDRSEWTVDGRKPKRDWNLAISFFFQVTLPTILISAFIGITFRWIVFGEPPRTLLRLLE